MGINEKYPFGMAVPKGYTLAKLLNRVQKSFHKDYNTPKVFEAIALMEVA